MAVAQGARPSQLLGEDFRALAIMSRGLLARNVIYLTAVWAVVWTAFAVVHAFPHPGVIVLAALVVSSRQQALLNVYHDCIHALFLPGRRANDTVGIWLCASPCASPYWAAKARHLAHHRLLGTDDDPDAPLHRGPGFATRRRTLATFAAGVIGAYAVKVVFADDASTPLDSRRKRADLVHLAVVQASIWLLTTWLFDWWLYPLVWIVPLATVTVFTHQLRSFGEHALTADEEAKDPSRLVTTVSNPIERALVAPFNMNYHAEHHLFPWVPAARLPEVQRRLDEHPGAPARIRRRSYVGTLRHYVRNLPA